MPVHDDLGTRMKTFYEEISKIQANAQNACCH